MTRAGAGDAEDDAGTSCAPFEALVVALGTSALSEEDESRARAHLGECERCREIARLFECGDVDTSDPLPEAAALPHTPVEGAIVAGRYRLERLLGGGGMGIVWSATQTVTGQPVAIKFLRVDSERARRRLVREARAAAAVRHPNVVRILDVVELDAGAPALVMELLVGDTLQRMFDEGPVPLAELCSILSRVADALAAAHAAQVVHRDIKPENVFLARTESGGVEVRLVDFGIAKRTPLERGMASGTLTRSGALVGTPFYMSPEQALGEDDVDARADLWALGLLLYQGLSATLPTRGDNLGQVIKAIALTPFEPLERLVPGLPDDLAALSARLLSKKRSDRPSIDEARAVFARHAASGGDPASSRSTDGVAASRARAHPARAPLAGAQDVSRRRRRVVAAAIAVIALSGGAALTVRATRAKPGPPPTASALTTPPPASPSAGSSSPCPPEMVLVESWRGLLESFCMDRTEVTAGAYMACVSSGMCTPGDTSELSIERPQHIGRIEWCNYDVPGREDHPMNCVTWSQATTYCLSLMKRLPTVDEWRWAAKMGSKSYLYPWGDEAPTETQVCWRRSETCDVGAHPAGATASGLVDLVGNVWERTSTPGRKTGTHISCGGGFYEEVAADLLSSRCGDGWDDEELHDAGFRCVR